MPVIMEDIERKKKKEEKAKAKEVKKQKAAEKAEAAKLQAEQRSNVISKKSEKNLKKDAEEENMEDFLDPETPFGEKKQLSRIMPKQYCHAAVEKSWYSWWEKSEFFVAEAHSSKPAFVTVLPPPNVTGVLHIGHALMGSIQDTIIRWRRMSGFNTVWVPGMDHAGTATQIVVTSKIEKERNITRHDLGRENFLHEVWKWKEQSGGQILSQLRQLGTSLDWSREFFTMDDKRSKAVIEAFVRLHKEGLIYRDMGIVNWDCVLKTARSDDEVKYHDIKGSSMFSVPGYEKPVEFGILTSFAYRLEGNLGEIVVATTRVETMLGDTAIAVHPNDSRYAHLKNKAAIHPFNGRKIPIIFDDKLVEMEFGTGAVKITPAHDRNDFEAGKRHKLEFINIFTDDGRINSNGGPEFMGMPRFIARKKIIEALMEKKLHRGAVDNEMRLGIFKSSFDIMEPLLKPQWYVNCDSMAKDALNAVMDDENRKIELLPKIYMKKDPDSTEKKDADIAKKKNDAEWKRWLDNIRPWCISRQIWWGHQIPAWYVTLEEDEVKELDAYRDHWVVGRSEAEAQAEASTRFHGKKFEITQDPEVLDTWFSSALLPLSVFGWPDNTDDMKVFYPTSVLETGHDILFFWVIRMTMLCIKFGGDVPFRKVYLHPMLRDAKGLKMSKSKGNVIDPLEIINGISLEGLHKRLDGGNLDPNEITEAKEQHKKAYPNGIPECGADALRFSLLAYTVQSDGINLDIQKVVGYRQWCNKLWNAVRFSMSKMGDKFIPPTSLIPNVMPFSCQWILSVLNKAIEKTVISLEAYEFSAACDAVYFWWQSQLCDVFIEVIKPYFSSNDKSLDSERDFARDTLWVCLDTGLRLLHPFMPYLTEDLWQRIPQAKDAVRKESIMISDYPSVVQSWTNDKVEDEMKLIEAAVKSLRSLKALLPAKERFERRRALALCRSEEVEETISSHELEISALAGLSSLKILGENDAAPTGCTIDIVDGNLSVYLELKGTINAELELEKLRKKLEETSRQKETLEKGMKANGYKEKVKVHIHEENVAKLTKLTQELLSLEEAASDLRSTTHNLEPKIK